MVHQQQRIFFLFSVDLLVDDYNETFEQTHEDEVVDEVEHLLFRK